MSRIKKIITTTVSAIIIVAGAVVCAVRWNVWFGNQPESAYEVPAEPHNIILSYGEHTSSSRIFSWRADTMLQHSEVLLLNWRSRDTIHLNAAGCLVHSRAGKAAFYRAVADSLPAGNYSYCCLTGNICSAWVPLFTPDYNTRRNMQQFLVFGDVQDKRGDGSAEMFRKAFSRYSNPAAAVFVGDIIERPTDHYWQIFFSSIGNKTTQVPLIAATGNHEYLKGVRKRLDSRWIHVFGNPDNGPDRFLHTTYFLDFPQCRFIILDTDALQMLSDYTVMQTWLRKVLRERQSAWKIVVMHHPVYSAGKGRDNPLMWLAFSGVLQEADVVFCGYDHNYMRRTGSHGKPVYVLTNSSEKYYAPKNTIKADCQASYMRFYEDVRIYPDSIRINTVNADADTIFDTALLSK